MRVPSGRYKENEIYIYSYLTLVAGMTKAAACGIITNIFHESGFNYLAKGDQNYVKENGKLAYPGFPVGEYTSYGICQWHDTSPGEGRWTNLKNYCSRKGISHTTLPGQLSFLMHELSDYSLVWSQIHVPSDTEFRAGEVAYYFCKYFEVPAGYDEVGGPPDIRRNEAKLTFWPYYSGTPETIPLIDLGQRIVQIAKEQIGKSYSSGGNGPNTFDDAGLVYYCYTQAGYDLADLSTRDYYEKYKSVAKVITKSSVAAGDLLFYASNPEGTEYRVQSIAIATGVGGSIRASSLHGVIEEDSLLNPTYIYRILPDSQTSQEGILDIGDANMTSGESGITNYASLASNDPYIDAINMNLSRMSEEGFLNYGYLIDITPTENRGSREFKFYIPEFSEAAGAEWSTIDIIGRSVSILVYDHTSSRKITISLDLYAGTGIYEGETGDIVGKMHSDINFIKSLEYPDYTNPIVRPPATVHLILGSAVNMIGVVSGVQVNHMKPLDSQNRAMYVKLEFTVTQIAVNPPDYTDIIANRHAIAGTNNIDSITENNNTNVPLYANNERLPIYAYNERLPV